VISSADPSGTPHAGSRSGRQPSAPLELIASVAQRALGYRYRIWGFGEGPALLGLITAARRLQDDRYLRHVISLVRPWLSRRLEPCDHVACVEVLLELEALAPQAPWRDAAERWAELVNTAPDPVVGRPRVHRPDLESWATWVWVDCMHTDGPGLAALGKSDEALKAVDEAAAVLQDDSGLFCHGYDVAVERSNGVHWGRGCGWALLGLVDTLARVRNPSLEKRLDGLLSGLADHEQRGRWHTIVDDHTSPLENSVSALVAAAVLRGIRAGVVAERHRDTGERALAACLASVRRGVLLVSEATPVGDRSTYVGRKLGAYPWGQGPLLLALEAAHEAFFSSSPLMGEARS
jgi:rhamnogalacturonyl hydrolase YesR